jgi:bifunctional non-homologous end joining protein LigD
MQPAFPSWIEPMAATLTRERFAGPDWIFERKLDGIRLLAFKRGHDVQLFSRNQLPQNAGYPSVVDAIARLPVGDVILDGEALGVWGKQQALGYHVFDMMWLEGRDLTALTLDERAALLDQLPFAPPLYRVQRLAGPAPWERACEEGWEGVVAKRRDSRYEQRRSPLWLKMKCEASQELVVGGFTEPRGQRVALGALLVGYFDAGDFVFAGKVGTGLDAATLNQLRAALAPLEQSDSPFTRVSALPRAGVHWVHPEIVVDVAFMEWTAHGKLRHPRFVRQRHDKSAREVIREQT